jgi:transposase
LGPKVIILDKGIFHTRKDILAKIEAEMPKIRLDFLPPYSPDFNLIELFGTLPKNILLIGCLNL